MNENTPVAMTAKVANALKGYVNFTDKFEIKSKVEPRDAIQDLRLGKNNMEDPSNSEDPSKR